MRFGGEAKIGECKWSGFAATVPSSSALIPLTREVSIPGNTLGSAILSLLACSILLASPVEDS
jgi:hypothetical protein